ncbi:hypothetical protein B7P43_G16396 [Cryptotermes secundus]|uniref:Tc1-like transposase DDE domain-containing protein n=1 Tax=Cryptotermes secundus TaxID=105785 RepID=A0A2J7Q1G1_9NEOP|nr:hypothetical protein B7P43_G16396 [Cryptotermes secundus]
MPHYQPKSRCASVQWKDPSSPLTKKFKVTPSAGKVMLTMFWDYQGVLLSYFQKCHENVNSASYCEVLLKLWNAIRRRHPGQLASGVLLLQDNARPHTAQAAQERIQELKWELLEHSPYSPYLAPSDFHLFDLLKTTMVANVLLMMEEVEMEVQKWLRQQLNDFYAVGFYALVKQWNNRITDGGGHVEKSFISRF